MYPRILSHVFGWAKAHGHLSIESEERGSKFWVLVRTWDRSTFRRVCVVVLSATMEATFLAKIVDAAGPDTSVVSLHGGPHVLKEAFASYLGSGYRAKLVEYPTFDLRLLKRCLQRTAASVFGSLDTFSMADFVVNCLKGAETRDWMASCPALRKAIITNDLSMPGLVDVVAKVVEVWPLVMSYLKETGRKGDGDSLLVRSSTVGVCLHHSNGLIISLLFWKKGMDGYLYHDPLARMKFRLSYLLLEICKYHHYILAMIHIGT